MLCNHSRTIRKLPYTFQIMVLEGGRLASIELERLPLESEMGTRTRTKAKTNTGTENEKGIVHAAEVLMPTTSRHMEMTTVCTAPT